LEDGAEALLTKPIDFVALRTEIDGRVANAVQLSPPLNELMSESDQNPTSALI
jgi:hypothetical protein